MDNCIEIASLCVLKKIAGCILAKVDMFIELEEGTTLMAGAMCIAWGLATNMDW